MEDNDKDLAIDDLTSDEELFLKYVVQGEPELLYLDTYLTETFNRG